MDKIIIVDLDGVVKIIKVSKEVGIKYYVMVLIYDFRCEVFDVSGDLKLYIIVKYYVDDYLRILDFNYIIVYLGLFIDDVGIGKIEVDLYFDKVGLILCEDVVIVLKEVVIFDGFNN